MQETVCYFKGVSLRLDQVIFQSLRYYEKVNRTAQFYRHVFFICSCLSVYTHWSCLVGTGRKVKLTSLQKLEKIDILSCYTSVEEVWPCISWCCGVGWKSLPCQHACIFKLQPGFSLSFTAHSHRCAITGHLSKNSACYFWHAVKSFFLLLFYFGFRLTMKGEIKPAW